MPESEFNPPLAMILSVIIPARDEQESLPACLASLLQQSEPAFALGTEWELILVNDGSTDGSGEIIKQAAGRPGVRMIEAPRLDPSELTGKNAACWAGAQAAQGKLLLFTDADTIHEPGNLSRARHELERYGASLLSYSPRQITTGVLQRVTMPLVFAELAVAYPPAKVNSSEDRTAAANGQFLLVESSAYFDCGGHKALGTNVLEDVALAYNVKRAHHTIRFRYAPDALATRMYRSAGAMLEGWTKNLALLFPSIIPLALMRLLDLLLVVCIPVIASVWFFPSSLPRILLWVVWARVLWRFYARAAKSHFPAIDIVLSIFGLPIFIFLLMRSYVQVRVIKSVSWKGRSYRSYPR